MNLHFGVHTDPNLMQALCSSAPYARAKLLRQLIRDGLRMRQEEGETPPANEVAPTAGDEATEDLESVFGNAVRL